MLTHSAIPAVVLAAIVIGTASIICTVIDNANNYPIFLFVFRFMTVERMHIMALYKSVRPSEVSPLNPSNTCKVPVAKGEYHILNFQINTPVYIGVSNNLNRRMHEHIKSGELGGDNNIFACKIANGRTSQSRINHHESDKINKHKPPLNQRQAVQEDPISDNRKIICVSLSIILDSVLKKTR